MKQVESRFFDAFVELYPNDFIRAVLRLGGEGRLSAAEVVSLLPFNLGVPAGRPNLRDRSGGLWVWRAARGGYQGGRWASWVSITRDREYLDRQYGPCVEEDAP